MILTKEQLLGMRSGLISNIGNDRFRKPKPHQLLQILNQEEPEMRDPAEETANGQLGSNAWNRQLIQKHELPKQVCPNLDEYDRDGMVELDVWVPTIRRKAKKGESE